jgi:hypothetical protein
MIDIILPAQNTCREYRYLVSGAVLPRTRSVAAKRAPGTGRYSSSASSSRANADMLVTDDPLDNVIDTYDGLPL